MKKTILFYQSSAHQGSPWLAFITRSLMRRAGALRFQPRSKQRGTYYRPVDPRQFYAIAGPVNLILILVTLILFWKESVSLRLYFAASLVLYVAILILTLGYFLPRDLILFTWSIPDHLEQIRAVSAQWSYMSWLGSLLGLAGVLTSFKGLDTYYAIRRKVDA